MGMGMGGNPFSSMDMAGSMHSSSFYDPKTAINNGQPCQDRCDVISADGQYWVTPFRDHVQALFKGQLDKNKYTVKNTKTEEEKTEIQNKRKQIRSRMKSLEQYVDIILGQNQTFFQTNCVQVLVAAHLTKAAIASDSLTTIESVQSINNVRFSL